MLLLLLLLVIITESSSYAPCHPQTHRKRTESSSSRGPVRTLHAFPVDSVGNIIPTLTSAVSVAGVIAFHEAGHFLAAKYQGMKIESYNIGYGPKLLSFNDTSGTQFALRAVPLGGYVAFPANTEFDQETGEIIKELDDPDLLQNRPPLQRALVISAGVIANVFLAFILSTGAGVFSGISTPVYDKGIVVTSVMSAQAPAALSGIGMDDVVLSFDGKELLPSDGSLIDGFVSTVRRNEGRPLAVELMKKGSSDIIKTTVTPKLNSAGKVSIGLGINARVKEVVTIKATNPIDAMQIGAKQTWKLIDFTTSAFYRAFSNGFTGNEVGGPISVVQAGAKMAETSTVALVGFAATLSINLAILNALPFPALDGGQLAFVLVELVSGKPVPRAIKDSITGLAFGVLLLLGASTFVGDIGKTIGTDTPSFLTQKEASGKGEQTENKNFLKFLRR